MDKHKNAPSRRVQPESANDKSQFHRLATNGDSVPPEWHMRRTSCGAPRAEAPTKFARSAIKMARYAKEVMGEIEFVEVDKFS